MVTTDYFRQMALSFPETTEEPHFNKRSFRVKKKIFATCDEKNRWAFVRLSETVQSVFISAGGKNIYPVDNKWGKQGWTVIEMDQVNKELFVDALSLAYCEVAPKKLADLVRPGYNDQYL